MYKRFKSLLLLHSVLFCYIFPASSQQKPVIKLLETPPIASIRGMSVVNDSTIWVSGTGGQAGLTTDGGQHWQWIKVPDHDSADWRSLHAFSKDRALLLNAGSPAHLMLTRDGGKTWNLQYEDTTKGIFFDDIAFLDSKKGLAMGDPMPPDNKFVVIVTEDAGDHWKQITHQLAALPGEALFAASGTNVVPLPNNEGGIITGGQVSRYIPGTDGATPVVLPITQGSASKGAFSLAFKPDGQMGVIVGGDYQHDKDATKNCVYTSDYGKTWKISPAPPAGYRSCVVYVKGNVFLATGTSGTDISKDAGVHWEKISEHGFHVAAVSPNGKKIWLAGSHKLGIIELP